MSRFFRRKKKDEKKAEAKPEEETAAATEVEEETEQTNAPEGAGSLDPALTDSTSQKKHYTTLLKNILPSLQTYTNKIEKLPQKNGFNPHQFIQKLCTTGIHPDVILLAIKSIHDHWETIRGSPWQYTAKLIQRKQEIKENEGFKKNWLKYFSE